jgi:NADH-quinone oxidoreductase subunit E
MVVAYKRPSAREKTQVSWENKIGEIFYEYGRGMPALLPCLKLIQETSGYIPQEAVGYLTDTLPVPASSIYSVASFYGMLTTGRQGKYVIRVCSSLVCAISASDPILSHLEQLLGIKPGETTPDRLFSLESVPCLGLCDLAPALMINDQVFGPLTEAGLEELINGLKENR